MRNFRLDIVAISIGILFLGNHTKIFCQSPEIDSLEKKLQVTTEPNGKVDLYNQLSWQYRFSKVERARECAQAAADLAEANQYVKGWSSAYNTLALIINESGNPEKAIILFDKAFKGKEEIGDRKGMAMIMNNKGIPMANLGQFDEARKCYEYALKYRLEVGDKKGIGDCYNQLGKLARDQGNYKESLEYFNKSLEIRLEINDKRGIAYSYVNLAANYSDQSDYIKSMENLQKAIPILEEIKDKSSLIVAFNNLGISNKFLKNYPEAIRYNEESIRIATETGFSRYSINAWKSLGDIYLEMKNTSKARKSFETCLKLTEEARDTGDMAHCFSGLGKCYEKEGDLKSADYFFHRGTELAEKSGIARDRVRLSIQEAFFLYRRGDWQGAENLIQSCLPIAKKENLKLYLSEIYQLQALILKVKNPGSPTAEAYFEKYAALKDSIYKDDLPRQFAEQQTRFETERKEAELRLSRQNEEIARLQLVEKSLEIKQRNMALGLSMLAFLGLGLAGYFYLRKQKSETLNRERMATQKAEETERIRLAKDIHDEFGSGLTKIRFVAEMAIEKAGPNSEWAALLAPISKSATQLVDNMRDLIWVLHPANNTLDILVARIREYAHEYLDDFGIETRFNIPSEIPEISVSKEVHRNLLMVVKEGLQNIAKHSGASEVVFTFEFGSDFDLQISDNGKGFDLDSPSGKGNGLKNMTNRISQSDGKINMESEPGKGTTLQIRIPLQKTHQTENTTLM